MSINPHKYPYKWLLSQLPPPNLGRVFSCFACGGGSTMGYKLAGFDVIGCNEIDERMNDCYVANHHPRLNYLCDIRDMVKMDLPEEMYHLDILDGSPPCSSFSTSGNRDKDWGKEKMFREGQCSQVLDTLFFDFIALARRLRPKVVIAENVRGLLLGNAKSYVARIEDELDEAGYNVQYFLLDAQNMGVPQRRKRVFFLCLRKDLATPFLRRVNLFDYKPYINMEFNEPMIPLAAIKDEKGKRIIPAAYEWWQKRENGDSFIADALERAGRKRKYFDWTYGYDEKVCPTLTAHEECVIHFTSPRYLSRDECCKASTFPLDYDFAGQKFYYLTGMSVPPVMMAQVASRVWEYWLSKL